MVTPRSKLEVVDEEHDGAWLKPEVCGGMSERQVDRKVSANRPNLRAAPDIGVQLALVNEPDCGGEYVKICRIVGYNFVVGVVSNDKDSETSDLGVSFSALKCVVKLFVFYMNHPPKNIGSTCYRALYLTSEYMQTLFLNMC